MSSEEQGRNIANSRVEDMPVRRWRARNERTAALMALAHRQAEIKFDQRRGMGNCSTSHRLSRQLPNIESASKKSVEVWRYKFKFYTAFLEEELAIESLMKKEIESNVLRMSKENNELLNRIAELQSAVGTPPYSNSTEIPSAPHETVSQENARTGNEKNYHSIERGPDPSIHDEANNTRLFLNPSTLLSNNVELSWTTPAHSENLNFSQELHTLQRPLFSTSDEETNLDLSEPFHDAPTTQSMSTNVNYNTSYLSHVSKRYEWCYLCLEIIDLEFEAIPHVCNM